MLKRILFATAMVLVTALAFTGPAVSEPDPQMFLSSSQFSSSQVGSSQL
ncbi:hypothetical protein [Microbulbifer magnicolonia]|nr:hypothetical protein [Microbulbifer sp. GG15]